MGDMYQFSEGFQTKILALLARDKITYQTFGDIVKPMYFRKEEHIDICRIIHDYYSIETQRSKSKGTSVNIPTLEVLLEEVRKLCSSNSTKKKLYKNYVDEMCRLVDVDLTDAEYIKDSIVKFGRRAALEHAILKSVEEIEKGTEDFSEVEDRISKAIRVGEDLNDLGMDFFAEAEERVNSYNQGYEGIKKVPTGMDGLDKLLKGGLAASELGVVIAPPNRGKSFALINIGAGALSEGHSVVHYTLEMPEKQVARRYDLRLSKKNLDWVKQNPNNIVAAITNLQKAYKGQFYIKKYRTNECSVDTLRSHLTKLVMEKDFKPGLIVVDYADLLSPRKSYKDKRFELESIYLELRDLGDEFDCPVWTASQTNRGGLDKKIITIGDLAEAFNKANIADFMVTLCQSTEEKEQGIMRWYVAKHRDGIANVQLDGTIDYATAVMNAFESGEVD